MNPPNPGPNDARFCSCQTWNLGANLQEDHLNPRNVGTKWLERRQVGTDYPAIWSFYGATHFSNKGGFWSRKIFEVSHLEVPKQNAWNFICYKTQLPFTKFKGWEKLKNLRYFSRTLSCCCSPFFGSKKKQHTTDGVSAGLLFSEDVVGLLFVWPPILIISGFIFKIMMLGASFHRFSRKGEKDGKSEGKTGKSVSCAFEWFVFNGTT